MARINKLLPGLVSESEQLAIRVESDKIQAREKRWIRVECNCQVHRTKGAHIGCIFHNPAIRRLGKNADTSFPLYKGEVLKAASKIGAHEHSGRKAAGIAVAIEVISYNTLLHQPTILHHCGWGSKREIERYAAGYTEWSRDSILYPYSILNQAVRVKSGPSLINRAKLVEKVHKTAESYQHHINAKPYKRPADAIGAHEKRINSVPTVLQEKTQQDSESDADEFDFVLPPELKRRKTSSSASTKNVPTVAATTNTEDRASQLHPWLDDIFQAMSGSSSSSTLPTRPTR